MSNPEVLHDQWEGCYRGGWKAGHTLSQAAFSHPAKGAHNLAKRIYEHVVAEGWAVPGETRVVDPFGGVGGFAFHALMNGLQIVTCELEGKFVNLSKENKELWRRNFTGLPGFDADNWVILHGDSRKLVEVLSKSRLSENRHDLNSEGLSVSSPPYGQRTVHGQAGIDWEKAKRSTLAEGGQHGAPGAGLDQNYGDTEGQLARMPMSEGKLDMAVTSPPYVSSLLQGEARDPDRMVEREQRYLEAHPELADKRPAQQTYGSSEGQLGTMKEGDLTMAISSPPYSGNSGKHDHTGHERAQRRSEEKGYRQGLGCFKTSEAYGDELGQLGRMEEGDLQATLAVSSPPFLEGRTSDRKQSRVIEDQSVGSGYEHRASAYGEEEGQLGQMKEGDLNLAISSPPYINSVNAGDHGIDWTKVDPKSSGNRKRGEDCAHGKRLREQLSYTEDPDPANMGAMPAGDLAASLTVSSPPYPQPHSSGGGINVDGYSKDWKKNDMRDLVGKRTYQGRGADRGEGNLETMDAKDFDAAISHGDFQAAVTSPPYEHDSEPHGDLRPGDGRQAATFIERDYGAEDGNISASPNDFWSASRVILEQLYQVLSPASCSVR